MSVRFVAVVFVASLSRPVNALSPSYVEYVEFPIYEAVYGTVLTANGEYWSNIYETPETIIANGYPAERHNVVTEDGYILELHRIPAEEDSPIVFLMHGILSASNAFIANGPEYGIAYNYADAGYDVWMGNARGTRNSRRHVFLGPDNPEHRHKFFDFSFEEIGLYDIPASVDYVLNYTGRENLHYIGHSQGGSVFMVLNSMKPEYNKKFKSAHFLAGVGYQEHHPNKILRTVAKFIDMIYNMAVSAGLVELFPPAPIRLDENALGDHLPEFCAGDFNFKNICEEMGMREIINNVQKKSIEIGGAAVKQAAHFGQNIRDKKFRRWNYGTVGNLRMYHRLSPPEYDLSLIKVNVTMHYTAADSILDERDVLAMAKDMPEANVRKVARDDFLHTDFIFSKDTKELVTDYIIHAISIVEPK